MCLFGTVHCYEVEAWEGDTVTRIVGGFENDMLNIDKTSADSESSISNLHPPILIEVKDEVGQV
jgi:hypothetical protein